MAPDWLSKISYFEGWEMAHWIKCLRYKQKNSHSHPLHSYQTYPVANVWNPSLGTEYGSMASRLWVFTGSRLVKIVNSRSEPGFKKINLKRFKIQMWIYIMETIGIYICTDTYYFMKILETWIFCFGNKSALLLI